MNERKQICPVCNGKETVPREFYEPDLRHYTAVNYRVTCKACGGRGIV